MYAYLYSQFSIICVRLQMLVTDFSIIIIIIIISSSETFFVWETLVSIIDNNFRSDLCLIELDVSNILEFKSELSFYCAIAST
jgi:hypothetical protein